MEMALRRGLGDGVVVRASNQDYSRREALPGNLSILRVVFTRTSFGLFIQLEVQN